MLKYTVTIPCILNMCRTPHGACERQGETRWYKERRLGHGAFVDVWLEVPKECGHVTAERAVNLSQLKSRRTKESNSNNAVSLPVRILGARGTPYRTRCSIRGSHQPLAEPPPETGIDLDCRDNIHRCCDLAWSVGTGLQRWAVPDRWIDQMSVGL